MGVLFLATLAPLASTIPTESIPVEVQGPQPKPLQAETRPPKHSLAYRSTPEEIQSGKLTPLEFMQMIAPVEFYKGEPPPEMAALMESQKNRTDAANAKLLDKRQTIVIFSPYKCPDRQTFRRATCNEEGLNQIETHCLIPGTYPNGDRRINHVTPCEDLICVPRYLGDNPEKAACVSLIVLLHEWTKNGGSKECTGINNKHLQDQQVHVITLAFHNGKGYVPEEVCISTLSSCRAHPHSPVLLLDRTHGWKKSIGSDCWSCGYAGRSIC